MAARGEVEAVRVGPRMIRVNLDSLDAAARPISATALAGQYRAAHARPTNPWGSL